MLTAAGVTEIFVHIEAYTHHDKWDRSGMTQLSTFQSTVSDVPATPVESQDLNSVRPYFRQGPFYWGELVVGHHFEVFVKLNVSKECCAHAEGSFRQVLMLLPAPPSPASASASFSQGPSRAASSLSSISEQILPSTDSGRMSNAGGLKATGRMSQKSPKNPWAAMPAVFKSVKSVASTPAFVPEVRVQPSEVVIKVSAGLSFRKVQVQGLPGRYEDILHVPTGSLNEYLLLTQSSVLLALAQRGIFPRMYSLSIVLSKDLPSKNLQVAGYSKSVSEYVCGRTVSLKSVEAGRYSFADFLVTHMQVDVIVIPLVRYHILLIIVISLCVVPSDLDDLCRLLSLECPLLKRWLISGQRKPTVMRWSRQQWITGKHSPERTTKVLPQFFSVSA